MTAVGERETSVTEESVTVPAPRDPCAQGVPPLPIRSLGGFGAQEQHLVAALVVHAYGRRPGDLCAVLAGLAETPS